MYGAGGSNEVAVAAVAAVALGRWVDGDVLVGRCNTMCNVLFSLPLHFPSFSPFLSLQTRTGFLQ